MRLLLVALGIAGIGLACAGCYSPSYSDCTITCSQSSGCPSGLECSADGHCVEPGGSCTGGGDGSISAANRAFVTSSTHTGALGTAAERDGICMMRANEAGLTGNFIAYLFVPGVMDPSQRLAGSRGWVDTTGKIIADMPDQWASGKTYYPIKVDERGRPFAGGNVWIGSPNASCNGWTVGDPSVSGTMFPMTDAPDATAFSATCDKQNSLLCLEIGKNKVVVPEAMPGRLVFVTPDVFAPGQGINGADGFCNSEAQKFNITGNFLAFLSKQNLPPGARFPQNGMPFRRLDGLLLAPTPAAFLDGTTNLDTFPIPPPTQLKPPVYNWTGNNGISCADWTSQTATTNGVYGFHTSTMKNSFLAQEAVDCTNRAPLVCVEQ